MSPKHTPGPWHDAGWGFITKRGPQAIADDIEDPCHPDSVTICTLDWDRDHGLEDARLIAAAPAMLDALEHVEAILTIVEPRSDSRAYREALADVRAAIALTTRKQER